MAELISFEQVHEHNPVVVLDSARGSEHDNTEEEEEEEEEGVDKDKVRDIDQKVDEEDEFTCAVYIFEQYLQEGNFPKPDEIDPPDEDTDIFSDMTMLVLLAYVFVFEACFY